MEMLEKKQTNILPRDANFTLTEKEITKALGIIEHESTDYDSALPKLICQERS